jgi:hypothetical protein
VPVKEEEIRGEYKTLRSVRKLCCGFKSLRTYVCMRGDWVFFFFFSQENPKNKRIWSN